MNVLLKKGALLPLLQIYCVKAFPSSLSLWRVLLTKRFAVSSQFFGYIAFSKMQNLKSFAENHGLRTSLYCRDSCSSVIEV